jgi:PAP2 superfamily
MWLPWTWSLAAALVLLAISLVLRARKQRANIAYACRELAIVAALYTVWQLASTLSFGHANRAAAHGLWLAHLESVLGWPSEQSIQRPVLTHPLIMRAADLYYAGVHVPVAIITLVWIFFWRRANWNFARTTVALLTGFCLVIQYIPVAPPRLLPGLGIVDTALRDGLSVYKAIGGADQLSAMPSLHIGWSSAVALLLIVSLRTKWRWLAVLYPLVTLWAVVVTGNHFIIDGVVSVLLLAVAAGIAMAIPSQRPMYRSGVKTARPATAEAVPAAAD